MSWIESHQALRKHPKTLMAVAELRVDRHKFIGHLMCLWWWGLDVADSEGRLPSGTTPRVIADAAEWPLGKAGQFVSALINCHGQEPDSSGFLEEVDGRYILHDWWYYAGKYNDLKAANKERQQAFRNKRRNTDVTVTSQLNTPLPDRPDRPYQTDRPNRPDHGGDEPRIDALSASFARYGTVTAGTPDAIAYSVKDYSLDWVERAVRVGAGASVEGRPGWNYVESILERWQKQGGPDDDKPRVQQHRGAARGGVPDTSANASDRAEARLRA